MGKNNIIKFMAFSSKHVTNLNRALRALKTIKSDVKADYVCPEHTSITIVTNKITLVLDLKIIENYIKNVKNVNSEDVEIPRLLQSKSYLRIISISYFMENTNIPITVDFIESVIKANHIFDNLLLASKL